MPPYRQLLASFPKHWEERTYLLSWVDPGEIPIHMQEGERVVGSGLIIFPWHLSGRNRGRRSR